MKILSTKEYNNLQSRITIFAKEVGRLRVDNTKLKAKAEEKIEQDKLIEHLKSENGMLEAENLQLTTEINRLKTKPKTAKKKEVETP